MFFNKPENGSPELKKILKVSLRSPRRDCTILLRSLDYYSLRKRTMWQKENSSNCRRNSLGPKPTAFPNKLSSAQLRHALPSHPYREPTVILHVSWLTFAASWRNLAPR